MSPITDQSAHLHGRGYGPRLVGEARARKARELAVGYVERHATIRALVAQHGMSYGTVRSLLLEVKVTLRPRSSRMARPAGGDDR